MNIFELLGTFKKLNIIYNMSDSDSDTYNSEGSDTEEEIINTPKKKKRKLCKISKNPRLGHPKSGCPMLEKKNQRSKIVGEDTLGKHKRIQNENIRCDVKRLRITNKTINNVETLHDDIMKTITSISKKFNIQVLSMKNLYNNFAIDMQYENTIENMKNSLNENIIDMKKNYQEISKLFTESSCFVCKSLVKNGTNEFPSICNCKGMICTICGLKNFISNKLARYILNRGNQIKVKHGFKAYSGLYTQKMQKDFNLKPHPQVRFFYLLFFSNK